IAPRPPAEAVSDRQSRRERRAVHVEHDLRLAYLACSRRQIAQEEGASVQMTGGTEELFSGIEPRSALSTGHDASEIIGHCHGEPPRSPPGLRHGRADGSLRRSSDARHSALAGVPRRYATRVRLPRLARTKETGSCRVP